MIYFLLSILVITLVFYFLHKRKILAVCPICAGTVLTWFGGLAALYTNQLWASPLLVAILMGASLGALAEKFGPSYGLLWKTGVVLLGFPASYFFVQQSVWPGLGLIVLLLLLTLISKKKPVEKEDKKDLFKECC
jgi:uncharacterized membrane protein YadS